MQLVKLQVIPSSPYRSGLTSKGHVFPVTLKSAAVFVLVMTTAMQVEALMLLQEHVLANHTVPAFELRQVLHQGCRLRGLHCLDVSAETSGKRHVTRRKLTFCMTKISISSRRLCPSLFVTAISMWFLRGTLPSLPQAEVGRDKPSHKTSSPSPVFSLHSRKSCTFLAGEKHLVRIPYKCTTLHK